MGIHDDLKNLPGCVALLAHLVILCFQLVALPFAVLVALSHVVLCWPVFHGAVEVDSGDAAALQLPTIQVYSNVSGAPYSSVGEIKELLKRQLLEPVKWEQTMAHLLTLSCNSYIEPGPGKQLKAMMRRINQDAWGKTTTLEK